MDCTTCLPRTCQRTAYPRISGTKGWETHSDWPDDDAGNVTLRLAPEDEKLPGTLLTSPLLEDDTAFGTNGGTSPDQIVDIRDVVDYYQDAGDFADDTSSKSIQTHLTAVVQFEEQQEGEKVVKHMKDSNNY
ncbi:hypothetical protein WMZ97_12265 [Lentibacillus sp. N15]